MDEGITLRAAFLTNIFFSVIYIVMGSFPILRVFSHPCSEDSPMAFAIAFSIPLIIFIYFLRKNVIEIRDQQISYINLCGFKSNPINIDQIQNIESIRHLKDVSLVLNLKNKERIRIPVYFLELKQIAFLLFNIHKINNKIQLPPDLKEIAVVYDDTQKRTELLKTFEKNENRKAYNVLFIALASTALYIIWKVSTDADYSFKELVDFFVHSI